jgi:hypothetical protein
MNPGFLERIRARQPELTPIAPAFPDAWRLPWWAWVAATGIFLLSWVLLLDGGSDWVRDIGPAARAWWPAPWREGFPQLPWAAALLSPLGGLADRLATAITNAASLLVLAAVARRYRGPEWVAIPVLLTPPGYWLMANGQTEWLVLLGLTFYNGLDPILILIKPQVISGVMVPRLARAGRSMLRYALPGIVVGGMSLFVWPAWPLRIWVSFSGLPHTEWNSSTWPWGIPIGLGLLILAYRSKSDLWGVLATPFLFPYVNMPSYLGPLIMIAAHWPKWFMIGWGVTWVAGICVFLL